MVDFLLNNWKDILFILLLLVGGIYLFFNNKQMLYKVLLVLVTQAEKHITGDKVGKERFEQVLTKVYDWLPNTLKWFISKELLKDAIEKALKIAKEKWEEYPELLDLTTADDEILRK